MGIHETFRMGKAGDAKDNGTLSIVYSHLQVTHKNRNFGWLTVPWFGTP